MAPDAPFVNNYGVWVDEIDAIGFKEALCETYVDALTASAVDMRDTFTPAAEIGENSAAVQGLWDLQCC